MWRLLAKERQRAAQRRLAELADAYRCRVNLQWKASLGCVKAKVRIKLRLKSKAARQGRIRQAKEDAVLRDAGSAGDANRAPESSLKARLTNAVGWARRQMSPSPSLMEKVGFTDPHSPTELEAFPDDFGRFRLQAPTHRHAPPHASTLHVSANALTTASTRLPPQRTMRSTTR